MKEVDSTFTVTVKKQKDGELRCSVIGGDYGSTNVVMRDMLLAVISEDAVEYVEYTSDAGWGSPITDAP